MLLLMVQLVQVLLLLLLLLGEPRQGHLSIRSSRGPGLGVLGRKCQ
jgi:hypothetical protein